MWAAEMVLMQDCRRRHLFAMISEIKKRFIPVYDSHMVVSAAILSSCQSWVAMDTRSTLPEWGIMGRRTPKSCLMCTVLQKNWKVQTHTRTHTCTHAHREKRVLSVFAHIFASYCFATLKKYTLSFFSKRTTLDLNVGLLKRQKND